MGTQCEERVASQVILNYDKQNEDGNSGIQTGSKSFAGYDLLKEFQQALGDDPRRAARSA